MNHSWFQRAVVQFDALAGGFGPQAILSTAFLPMFLGGLMLLSLLDDGWNWAVAGAGCVLLIAGLSILILYGVNGYQKIKLERAHEQGSTRMNL